MQPQKNNKKAFSTLIIKWGPWKRRLLFSVSMFVITSVCLFMSACVSVCVIYAFLKCMSVNALAQTWTTAACDWRTPRKCQESSSSIQSQSALILPVVYSLNPCNMLPGPSRFSPPWLCHKDSGTGLPPGDRPIHTPVRGQGSIKAYWIINGKK